MEQFDDRQYYQPLKPFVHVEPATNPSILSPVGDEFVEPIRVVSSIGAGPKGDKGDPTYFDDLTEEQLQEIYQAASFVGNRSLDEIVTTTGASTTTIPIPWVDYDQFDMLFIDVNGLDLSEHDDYEIVSGNIVLTTPLPAGQDVHFRLLRYDVVDGDKNIVNTMGRHDYNTVAEMQADKDLEPGDICHTLGFHASGDGGAAWYKIKAHGVANGMDILDLENDCVAFLQITESYVTPEMFGAVSDKNATTIFNRIFEYLADNAFGPGEEEKTCILDMQNEYIIDIIQMPDIDNLTIKNGIIHNGGFYFPSTSGYKVTFENVTFIGSDDNTATAIQFDYRNMEYSRYTITGCVFWKYGKALHIERRSCHVIIEKCNFKNNLKTGYFHDNDSLVFRNNWIEANRIWEANHDDVEIYAENEGDANIYDNFFIPGVSMTNDCPCWIKTGKHAVIARNRFSNENSTIHPIHVKYDNYSTYSYSAKQQPTVVIDSNMMGGANSILLDKFYGQVILTHNYGYMRKFVEYYDTAAEDFFDAITKSNMFQLVLNQNTGRTFMFEGDLETNLPADLLPLIPDGLVKYIRNKENTASYNYIYDYEVSGNTLTIHQPVKEYLYGTNTTTPILGKMGRYLVGGYCELGGSAYYNQPFLVAINLVGYYSGAAVTVKAIPTVIYGETFSSTWPTQTFTYSCTLNGNAEITSDLASLITSPIDIALTVAFSGSQVLTVHFTNVMNLDNEFGDIKAIFN